MGTTGHHPGSSAAQAGFSMVEMLMAAFIMAVGILGLSALQVMALKATRGSRSLSTAILVAEQVLDRAEMEGRLSWLNLTDRNATSPSLGDLSGLRYITQTSGTPLVDSFNSQGRPVLAASSDPPGERDPLHRQHHADRRHHRRHGTALGVHRPGHLPG